MARLVVLPKYVTVAEALEAEVHKGAWSGGRLPSVRGIAVQHNVSVVTATRALQILRDKGLVHTRDRSGCYRVPPPAADRWAVCLRLTTGPWRAATEAVVRAGFDAVAATAGSAFRFDAFDLTPGLTPADAETAARQAKADGLKGVFLLPSRTDDADAVFLAGCRAAGLPVVLVERNVRGAEAVEHHDLVGLDDVAGAAAATRHLLGLGRRRVGLVLGSATSSHHDRLAGYLFALATAPRKGGRPVEVVLHQRSGKDGADTLAEAVARERLDAVLCYSDYAALGLVMELLRRGVRVPADVAVAGFDNLPFGESFAAGLTTLDYPARAMADHALRLMRERAADPRRPAVKVCVPGRLIVRGSTDPEAR